MRSWLVSYDVSNDRARSAIFRKLSSLGLHHLYSCFLLDDVESASMQQLVEELGQFIASGDSLIATPICSACSHVALGEPIESVDGLLVL